MNCPVLKDGSGFQFLLFLILVFDDISLVLLSPGFRLFYVVSFLLIGFGFQYCIKGCICKRKRNLILTCENRDGIFQQ